MLQTQTVVPELLELLKKIMVEELFRDYFLVGGTALSLQIGHRNSIDIDLFGNCDINADLFIEKLKNYGEVIVTQNSKNILITEIGSIKVDFVNYKYPLLSNPIKIDNIRMLATTDIAAMKLNAIAGRGSRKDFIDLYFLLDQFTMKQMLDFYLKKYSDGSEFMVTKSLLYFEDADNQLNPKMLKNNFDWEKCKQKIIQEVIKLE
jgi:hypothetical protein